MDYDFLPVSLTPAWAVMLICHSPGDLLPTWTLSGGFCHCTPALYHAPACLPYTCYTSTFSGGRFCHLPFLTWRRHTAFSLYLHASTCTCLTTLGLTCHPLLPCLQEEDLTCHWDFLPALHCLPATTPGREVLPACRTAPSYRTCLPPPGTCLPGPPVLQNKRFWDIPGLSATMATTRDHLCLEHAVGFPPKCKHSATILHTANKYWRCPQEDYLGLTCTSQDLPAQRHLFLLPCCLSFLPLCLGIPGTLHTGWVLPAIGDALEAASSPCHHNNTLTFPPTTTEDSVLYIYTILRTAFLAHCLGDAMGCCLWSAIGWEKYLYRLQLSSFLLLPPASCHRGLPACTACRGLPPRRRSTPYFSHHRTLEVGTSTCSDFYGLWDCHHPLPGTCTDIPASSCHLPVPVFSPLFCNIGTTPLSYHTCAGTLHLPSGHTM